MADAISGIQFLPLNRPPRALDVRPPSDCRGAHASQAPQSDVHYPHIPGDQAGIKEEPLTICFCGDAAIMPDGVPEERGRGHAPLIPALRGCIWVTLVCLNALVNKNGVFSHPPGHKLSGFIPENEEHRRSDILAIPVLPS